MQHYDEITVSALCERMQIPRKSFYRYFTSKEGALQALIDYALMDFETFSVSSDCGTGSVEEKMERLFAYWLHQKKLLDALARSGLSGLLIYRAVGMSAAETAQGRKHLSVQEQQAQGYFALFAVSGFMSLVIQWHHDGYPQSVQQMTQIAVRLVSQPLMPYLMMQEW